MERPPIVTLITDFGHTDPFVGILHGVILRECPAARVVDLCHGILPQDVRAAAFWVGRCHAWFPPGTCHVVVVDPGVGTARRALALRAYDQYFVAPDNGLLTSLFEAADASRVRVIDDRVLGLPAPSRTFHGRDVFAPVAGRLASGALSLDAVGDEAGTCVRLGGLVASLRANDVEGEVILLDRFGNLLTNVTLGPVVPSGIQVTIGPVRARFVGTYAEGSPGEPIALINAFGVLEIAVREAHAGHLLALGRGAPVRVRLNPAVPPGADGQSREPAS